MQDKTRALYHIHAPYLALTLPHCNRRYVTMTAQDSTELNGALTSQNGNLPKYTYTRPTRTEAYGTSTIDNITYPNRHVVIALHHLHAEVASHKRTIPIHYHSMLYVTRHQIKPIHVIHRHHDRHNTAFYQYLETLITITQYRCLSRQISTTPQHYVTKPYGYPAYTQ